MSNQVEEIRQSRESNSTIAITVNPLDLLNEIQRKALGARFNKTWLSPRQAAVESLIRENGFDFFTAAFTLALQEDANGLISNKAIAAAADRMAAVASGMFGTPEEQEATLRSIEAAYDSLEPIQRTASGKRFRTLINKGFTSKMGARILDAVCTKLDVREAEWC
jgi:hypothetical protein